MSKQTEVPAGIVGLLIAVVIFLAGIFANLFAASVPTAASTQGTAIPLEGASLSDPSQLQGNSAANPQNAAKVAPGDLGNGL